MPSSGFQAVHVRLWYVDNQETLIKFRLLSSKVILKITKRSQVLNQVKLNRICSVKYTRHARFRNPRITILLVHWDYYFTTFGPRRSIQKTGLHVLSPNSHHHHPLYRPFLRQRLCRFGLFMMGACLSSNGDDAEARKRSQAIDRKINEDSRRLRRECKILLLGSSTTGHSFFFFVHTCG